MADDTRLDIERLLKIIIGLAVVAVIGVQVRDCSQGNGRTEPRASTQPTPSLPRAMGRIAVDRAWAGAFGWGYALVTYENTTRETFDGSVQIRCDALDSQKRIIGTDREGIYAFERGPLQPGFRATIEVQVGLNKGAVFDSMNCRIEDAR